MTEQRKEKFKSLCQEEKALPACTPGEVIGTYREKRLHRVFKRWLCDDPQKHEQRVGRHVADLLMGEEIFEIQTKNLRALKGKLQGYLENTDYRITVIHPMIGERSLVRMDRETGEVYSARKSPKRATWFDALPELYWIREELISSRVTVQLFLITAEERRYSERMRYRREGAYDGELFPEEMIAQRCLRKIDDYKDFLPQGVMSFTASEYAVFSKQKGRRLYSCLNLLCALGLLHRETEGRQYRYWIVKNGEFKSD